jgi:cytochrome c biogenesis protein CcdA
MALAAGLALSYAIVGTTIAALGSVVGLDATALRDAGAIVLVLLGAVLLSSGLQQRFATATAGIGDAGNALVSRLRLDGLAGQFATGLALGVVWSPCVGPTLGAAIVLASQGSQLPQVATLMALFGVGAALPVLLLARLSRATVLRFRGRMLQAGRHGKALMGAVLMGVGLLILTGADKPLEAWLLDISPDWLTRLTTRF